MVFLEKISRRFANLRTKYLMLIRDFSGIILAFRVTWLQQQIVFVDKFGFQFWLYPGDPSDDLRFSWKHKTISDSANVINFVLKWVKPGSTCIDIGAAKAGISVPMWSKVGLNGKVFSIEADPTKIDKIKANLKLNSYPQNYVINAAISNKIESRLFRCYPKAPGWNTFGEPRFAEDYDSFLVNIQCVDFRHLLLSYNINFIDVVKIDTEGAELLILQGMRPYLKARQVSCVIFEVNPFVLPSMATTVHDLISFWYDLPYKLHQLSNDGTFCSLPRSWPDNKVGDCVAILE